MKFELSKLAISDIDNIWIYTSQQWSIAQADRYYKDIFKGINSICKNPELGYAIDIVKKDRRILKVKSHFIVYKVEEKTIFIDRILHERMYIEDQLTETN